MNSHDPVGRTQASYRIKRFRGLHADGARVITTRGLVRLAFLWRRRKVSRCYGAQWTRSADEDSSFFCTVSLSSSWSWDAWVSTELPILGYPQL